MPSVAVRFGAARRFATIAAPVTEVRAPAPQPARAIRARIDDALDRPIGARRLEDQVAPGARVVLIVSDATRDEPRAELVAAIRARLPSSVRLTLAIATGTHGRAGGLAAIGLGACAGVDVLDHDGHDPRDLVEVGVTARGTPVEVHRACVAADLVIATGVLRAHYFAGFGAGAKAIFPGLASARAARKNHLLKDAPGARAGVVDDNPCRLDLEEAARLAAPRAFVVNGVADRHDQVCAAVAGDVVTAFRAGAALASSWLGATARPHACVVVADRAPVTRSLYQASKCVAAVAPWVAPGGRVVVVAPCEDGLGPVDVVNRGIYELGLRPRLPHQHEVILVSSLPDAVVRSSYARPAVSLTAAIAGAPEVLVVHGASKLIARVAA